MHGPGPSHQPCLGHRERCTTRHDDVVNYAHVAQQRRGPECRRHATAGRCRWNGCASARRPQPDGADHRSPLPAAKHWSASACRKTTRQRQSGRAVHRGRPHQTFHGLPCEMQFEEVGHRRRQIENRPVCHFLDEKFTRQRQSAHQAVTTGQSRLPCDLSEILRGTAMGLLQRVGIRAEEGRIASTMRC